MSKTKAELLAEAEEAGIKVPASKKKAEIEEILAEADPGVESVTAEDLPDDAPDSSKQLAALDDPEAPLPHTPVEPLTEYRELGVAVPDVGPAPIPEDDEDDSEDEDAEASDDSEPLLEATPSLTEVFDTTEGSTRPEDGAV